jgi:hypothetical protein
MGNREILESRYAKLTTLEKFVVQLLSVIYEPCSKATIVRCLQECKDLLPTNNLSINASIGVILGKLQKLKLITNKNQCHPLFVEIASRFALQNCAFKKMSDAVQNALPLESGSTQLYSHTRCLRDIRIALYNADLDCLNKYLERSIGQFPSYFTRADPLTTICNNPFDITWFKQLPLKLQNKALKNIIDHGILCLESDEESYALLHEYSQSEESDIGYDLRDTFANRLLFSTQLDLTKSIVEKNQGSCSGLSKQAWLTFLYGDYAEAFEYFQLAINILKKTSKKKKVTLDHFSSLFYIMSAIKSHQPEHLEIALDYINLLEKTHDNLMPTFQLLKAATLIRQNKVNEANELIQSVETSATDSISILFLGLVLFWLEPELAKYKINKLISLFSAAERNGYTWIAYECAELLARLEAPQTEVYQQYANKVKQSLGICSVISLIQQEVPWQRSLNALLKLSYQPIEETQLSRCAWIIDQENKELTPVEQKYSIRSQWSKGRNIALSRLFDRDPSLDFLTEQDEHISLAIKKQTDSSGSIRYQIDFQRALKYLVGHSHLFIPHQQDLVAIELIRSEPELVIEQENKLLSIKLVPYIDDENKYLWKETPTRYKIIETKKLHHDIAKLLGPEGLTAPLEAKSQITNFVTQISSQITVQSAIGGLGKQIPRVDADSRLHLHLLPYNSGLRLELFVKPFQEGGPYFKPTQGGKTLIARIHGERMQTSRSVTQEKQNLQKLCEQCPQLSEFDDPEVQVLIEDPESCLELLNTLQKMPELAVLEWPEGQKFKLKPQKISQQEVTLSVSQNNDWFDIHGEVKIDEEHSIPLSQVLKALDDCHGRFIPLGEGEFIELTQEFMRRIKELKSYVQIDEDQVRFHKLCAHAVSEFIDTMSARPVDMNWKKQVKTLSETTTPPELPSTLTAELRSYQKEGYDWLYQLSQWGVGACLADDMGLGKTLQALAILLKRAAIGPSLIIAPTSVCTNWFDEIIKFAPSLKTHTLGVKDRKQTIMALGKFDILVCSYGLLQQEIDNLKEIRWSNIVLDEAQAIKNIQTKRAQAAISLQADFKFITTGTPIENHLGELWSLFEFINPGLLGRCEDFNTNFIQPIEKNDQAKRQHLKKLIRPFILRRTKSQVLDELPPRTEIVLSVEMSEVERNNYETLRKRALERFTQDEKGQPNHIEILSEITKLRRFCCNPRLIDENWPELISSKCDLFLETVDELLSNKHKALVFSQFVTHLDLLRQVLDARNIHYQYLDGATPMAQRKKRIDAFQNGEGDLFLISLKAGGSGLNLTAADYVIHMDPWWNPAVEDQASDRAHRMGQKRPVTVYRLIAKDSIEEKILALHHKKRDLANHLLSGSEIAAKLNSKELLSLIQS